MQSENRKLQEEVQNLKRVVDLRDKDVALARREVGGLQEDNERLNRMYLLMQKEAFNSVDKLKAKENEFVDYGKNA